MALRLSHVVTDEWGVKLIQDDLIARLAQPSPAPPPLSTDAGPTTSVDMADYEASPVGQRANDRALAYLADQLRCAPQTMFSHRPLAGEQPRYWTVEPRSRALLQAYHYGRHSPGALERRVTEIELERGICLDKLFRTAAVNFHLSALGVRAQVLFSTVNPANGGFGSARDLGLLYTELLHCAADGGNMLGTECCRAIIRRQSVIGFPASSVPRAYGLGFMVGLSDAGIGASWSDNSSGTPGPRPLTVSCTRSPTSINGSRSPSAFSARGLRISGGSSSSATRYRRTSISGVTDTECRLAEPLSAHC